MLNILLDELDLFDEETSEFIKIEPCVVALEHSLVSLSKWESKFEKPFLSKIDKTKEELFWYFNFMVIGEIPDNFFLRLSETNIKDIEEYINSSQTALKFTDFEQNAGSTMIITSDIIYSWLIAFSVPFECQFWHLNRLFSFLRLCASKNSKKKMSKSQLARMYNELNAKRKAEFNTSG